MDSASIDAARCAVLSMDLQAGIVSVYAKDNETLIRQASSVLDRARAAGITVIHVRVAFRPGLPEVSDRNQLFSAIKGSPKHQQFFEGESGAIHPALSPKENDLVVSKSRINAFTGTDLNLILRAKGIDTVVLFGIATSGVVLATLLHASDADYRVIVIKDCCADLDQELHQSLIEKLFQRHASVWTSEELMAAL
ncbi:MAG TPA: isochorismatase family cysteine hydrolase [Blastocatellia bacterium]|nr:isochorismatase family cysteine hydrolase [Blastocatellia bacterium]